MRAIPFLVTASLLLTTVAVLPVASADHSCVPPLGALCSHPPSKPKEIPGWAANTVQRLDRDVQCFVAGLLGFYCM